jgi:hypothetical protein
MSDMTDTVSDLPPRFAALAGAHRHALPSSCSRDTALPLPEPAIQPMMLVRYRPGVAGQTAHAVHQVSATAPVVEPPVGSSDSEGTRLINGAVYQAWGWPVIQHRDQIRLSLDCDVSAIAIPIQFSAEVTQILTERHCAPAVLAHPYAPEHHLILTGERFGVALPWPPSVQQVIGALMLPPTMTPRGPITWVQPPHQNSLHFSREIDVFSALHTVLGDSHR